MNAATAHAPTAGIERGTLRRLLEGRWKELKGRVGKKWGKLTEVDLTTIDGKREKLAGLLLQKYGIAEVHVEKSIAAFQRKLDQAP